MAATLPTLVLRQQLHVEMLVKPAVHVFPVCEPSAFMSTWHLPRFRVFVSSVNPVCVFPVFTTLVIATITIATTRIAAPIISKYSIAPCPLQFIKTEIVMTKKYLKMLRVFFQKVF